MIQREVRVEPPRRVNEARLEAVRAALRDSGACKVLDLGCGDGKLLRQLLKDRQFQQIVGLDVSIRSLEMANKRLKLDRLPDRQAERLKLIHGSLIYRDKRLGVSLDIGGFATFADYFFDGLIADWIMQSKIQSASSTCFSAISKVSAVLGECRRRLTEVERAIEDVKSERREFLERG